MNKTLRRTASAAALATAMGAFGFVVPVSAQSLMRSDAQTAALDSAENLVPPDVKTVPPVNTAPPASIKAPVAAPVVVKPAPPIDGKLAGKKRPVLSDKRALSSSVTVNLLNLLVKQGVIKEDQAKALIKQAEDEAYVTRQTAKDTGLKADEAEKTASAAAVAANPPGTKHVTYVPEIVKRQLRDEIRREVMAKAEAENWASPGKYPEWASRIKLYGDLRLRYQGNYFPGGNDQADAVNFNGINTGLPYDFGSGAFPPTYDATADRNLFRLRARLGAVADLGDGFDANIRLGTGDTAAPVSVNATFGSNGGDFSKYALYIDRAAIRYRHWGDDLEVYAGRFDNPFYTAVDHMWYRDLAFDGFAAQVKHEVRPDVTPFAVAGAFPIFNTDFNAGINLADTTQLPLQPTKVASHDKYLFAGQAGVIAKLRRDITMRASLALYDFDNVQGQASAPCIVLSSADTCSTDIYRPSYAQKGNTYFPLRNIISNPANNFGTTSQFQYFGLVGAYRPVVVDAALDFDRFNPVHVILAGEYINNTAFDAGLMNALAANNRAGTTDGSIGGFNGGNQGWMTRLTVGHPEIEHRWDWSVNAGYKYMESDATLDAFTDPDFGLGGTNLKGYFLGGSLGLTNNVWTTLRFMSANNISGTPFAVDVLQVDLNSKF